MVNFKLLATGVMVSRSHGVDELAVFARIHPTQDPFLAGCRISLVALLNLDFLVVAPDDDHHLPFLLVITTLTPQCIIMDIRSASVALEFFFCCFSVFIFDVFTVVFCFFVPSGL